MECYFILILTIITHEFISNPDVVSIGIENA